MYPDRCYCRVTRQYLSEALRSEFDDGRRRESFSRKTIFNTYDPATQTYKQSETIELDLHSFLDPIQARVAECKDRSRAILAYDQSNAENTCLRAGAPAPGEAASKLAETLAQVLAAVPKHQLDQRPGAKTVLVTQTQVGSHGGQILEVRKRSDSAAWIDNSDFPDVQGSPEIGAVSLGPNLSRYFGYSRLREGHDSLTIPDFKEIQGARAALNAAIIASNPKKAQGEREDLAWGNPHGPISTEFYDALPGTITPKTYLKRFAFDNQFPVGTLHFEGDQVVYFHDASFHVPGMILMPPEFVEAARTQVRSLFEFEDFFKKHYPQWSKDKEVSHVLNKIYLARATQIDSGSVLSVIEFIREDYLKRERESGSAKSEDEIQKAASDYVRNALAFNSKSLFGTRADGGPVLVKTGSSSYSVTRSASVAGSVAETMDGLGRTFGSYFVSESKREAFQKSLSQFIREKSEKDSHFTRPYPISIHEGEQRSEFESPRRTDGAELEAALLRRKEFLERVIRETEEKWK